MSGTFTVSLCRGCGYVAHPPRLLCPVCSAADWNRIPVGSGLVTEVTTPRPVLEARKLPNGDWVDQSQVQLVAVRAYGGIRVIARAYEGVGVGSRVELSTRDSGLEPELGQIIEARLPEPVGTAFNPHY